MGPCFLKQRKNNEKKNEKEKNEKKNENRQKERKKERKTERKRAIFSFFSWFLFFGCFVKQGDLKKIDGDYHFKA